MATITYGKSVVATNAKMRRHQRRRKEAIARQHLESIIDAALGSREEIPFSPSSKTEIIYKRKALKRPIKTILISKVKWRQCKIDTGSCYMPDVAIFRVGYRQFKDISAR